MKIYRAVTLREIVKALLATVPENEWGQYFAELKDHYKVPVEELVKACDGLTREEKWKLSNFAIRETSKERGQSRMGRPDE